MKRLFHALVYGRYRAALVHASSMRLMKDPIYSKRRRKYTPRSLRIVAHLEQARASTVDSVSDYGDWLA